MNKPFINNTIKEVGDYQWFQLSMWDLAPENCVETYIKSQTGSDIFHFILKRMTERVTETHTRWVDVTSVNGVPGDVLSWRDGKVVVRENRVRTEYKLEEK